jgi:hypothetical protein
MKYNYSKSLICGTCGIELNDSDPHHACALLNIVRSVFHVIFIRSTESLPSGERKRNLLHKLISMAI